MCSSGGKCDAGCLESHGGQCSSQFTPTASQEHQQDKNSRADKRSRDQQHRRKRDSQQW